MTDAPATTASDRSGPPAGAPQRHVGVDAARGLAIVGMIAAHVIPRFSDAELIVDGRPSILFAVLAGLSLGLLTPTRAAATPGDARAARRGARAALATRALLLMVLGLWLWTLPTNIAIILDAYGLMFLLMVPLLFANRVVLAVVGAGILALGPLLVSLTEPLPPFSVFSGASPIDRAAELVRDPVVVLADAFLTGYYPALLWLPLLCAGLIATRSDLTSTMTRLLMVTLGLAASLVGYGAAVFLPGVSAEAHAVTPAELLGSGGLAIAIIGGALLLLDSPGAFARASRIVLAPLIAIGRMPLTVYTLHVLLIALATEAFGIGPAGAYASPDGWWMLAALLVISAAVALIAMRRGSRGPLELALARVTAAVAAPRQRRDAGAGPGTARARARAREQTRARWQTERMMRRFAVVPQWQGSGAARAMRLAQGAEAIAADLPARATEVIEVPLEAGDAEGTGIHRYSSIRLVRERLGRSLADLEDGEIAVVVGGDCGVEYAGVERAARRGRVVLLWADAHADLNTAETSPSGAYHGMVLRDMIDTGLVAASDVVMLGVRALDDAEADAAERFGIPTVTPEQLGAAIAARAGDDAVLYVHIDLDVLDPAIMGSVGFAEPFGLSLDELIGAVRDARAALPLGGAGITEYAPAADADPELLADEAATILRVIAAVSAD